MKVVAIIQARMGSTRLPGKVMKPLAGRSVLAHVIARARACARVAEVVVATTTAPIDEAICAEAKRYGVGCFRGSESDVLSRYYEAARSAGAEVVVRITSDCPLLDPQVLCGLVAEFLDTRPDYLSNTLERSYPRGLDAEVFSFAALERAQREATQDFEREHVTPYLYRHPELFTLRSVRSPVDLSQHRWTLDTPEDWELIEKIYAGVDTNDAVFGCEPVLALLQRQPELAAINAHVEQKKLGQ